RWRIALRQGLGVLDQALTCSPLDLKNRTLVPSWSERMPTPSPLPLAGLNSMTFDWSIGIVLSTTPPVSPFMGFGRWCFLTRLTPSTSRRSGPTRFRTVPRLPLSRPAMTTTSSPWRIFCIAITSKDLGRQRHDLHELLGPQLAGHRSEDARADGLELVVEQHRGVAVEADQRAVGPAHALGGAHHDGVVDLAFLDPTARLGFLDAHLDDVANARVAALGAAQHLDTHD